MQGAVYGRQELSQVNVGAMALVLAGAGCERLRTVHAAVQAHVQISSARLSCPRASLAELWLQLAADGAAQDSGVLVYE